MFPEMTAGCFNFSIVACVVEVVVSIVLSLWHHLCHASDHQLPLRRSKVVRGGGDQSGNWTEGGGWGGGGRGGVGSLN